VHDHEVMMTAAVDGKASAAAAAAAAAAAMTCLIKAQERVIDGSSLEELHALVECCLRCCQLSL
jgi:hypothetical protein